MKSRTIFTLALIAFVAGALTYQFYPSLFHMLASPFATGSQKGAPARSGKGTIPGSYIGKNVKGADWADSASLEKRLEEDIIRELNGATHTGVPTFISKPQNRLMLAQWHLANRANAVSAEKEKEKREALTKEVEGHKKTLEKLTAQLQDTRGTRREALEKKIEKQKKTLQTREAELNSPRNTADLLSLNPDAADLLQQLSNNLDWMEQIAYSGECDNPGRALAILSAINKKHKNLAESKIKREIAAAVAIEWAKTDWAFEKALARADYFIRNWEAGRLHTCFDDLAFWQRRMVCGAKGHDAHGEAESLQWLLDNVNLPSGRYPGCCWQWCSYIRDNLFGDSIHGPMYYNPYQEIYGSNAPLRTHEVGGVCGALSHFAAFAAIANGIPAMTAGEPGHCANVVLMHNKWTPGYSLSWKRGLHWNEWRGISKFASLHMATELYSPEQEEKTTLSNAQVTLGKIHASRGDKEKAHEFFAAAVAAQPRNYIAWRNYADFLKEHKPQDASVWKQFNAMACRQLVPLYPEMGAELMKQHLYPALKSLKLTGAEMMEIYAAFWDNVDAMGPDRWDIEAFCGAQANTLKAMGGMVENCNLALYEMALGKCSSKKAYAPVILSWGNSMAAGLSPAMQQKFLKGTLSGLSKGGELDEGARDKMLGQALSGAVKMRDRGTFQAIGKMLSAKHKKNILPKWEPFPGKLASQGGMIYTSSSAHDDPSSHWGVLEPTGGRFHTAYEENPWVVVEMPKTVFITGVVAISTAGHNVNRLYNMKVQYSETGKDNDWHDAGAFPAPSTRAINRLDLQQSKPRARFIRIIRGGAKNFFHLNGIFVYGEQAA